ARGAGRSGARSRAARLRELAGTQDQRTWAQAGEVSFAASARTARDSRARDRKRRAQLSRDTRRSAHRAGRVRARAGRRAMSTAWQKRGEIGNTFWLRVIVWVSRNCGRSVAQFFMWPTALYFFVRRGPERRASRLYLNRVLGRSASAWNVFLHIRCFS